MINLLSQSQTDTLRSIGDSALVLFAMVMIDRNFPGRATKPEELLPYLHPTYKDVRKLRVQLDALSASNRLAKKGAGYILLEGGRALLLSMAPAIAESDKILALSPEIASGTSETDKNLDAEPARALRALKKEEEEILIINSEESSSSDSAQNAQALEIAPGVTTERILLATSTLEGFGDGVFLHGLEHAAIHPQMALGWIAQAYDQRETLSSPQGLVYRRLQDADEPKPRVKYYENWEAYLPEDFLQAVGLLALTCSACGATFETKDAFHEHDLYTMKCDVCEARFHNFEQLEAHQATHEPQVPTFPRLPADSRGAKAWAMVRSELERDMPKASFDTWVRDAAAAGFEGSVLTLAVRNSYACDWLTDRLKAKIEAMLKTYTQTTMQVKFVVGVVEDEHE